MAPGVPFALLGVVQLTAVAAWFSLAGAACFPQLRRRGTPAVVIGALVIAAAEAVTALRFGVGSSDPIAWLRIAGLALVGVGLFGGGLQPRRVTALPSVLVPLGARPLPAIVGGVVGMLATGSAVIAGWRSAVRRIEAVALAVALAFTTVAVVLAAPARHDANDSLALLAARGAATVALVVALAGFARANLLGKLVGAIVAAVVAMAAGAVGVVGNGVAGQVQHEQSQRLLQVAQGQQQA